MKFTKVDEPQSYGWALGDLKHIKYIEYYLGCHVIHTLGKCASGNKSHFNMAEHDIDIPEGYVVITCPEYVPRFDNVAYVDTRDLGNRFVIVCKDIGDIDLKWNLTKENQDYYTLDYYTLTCSEFDPEKYDPRYYSYREFRSLTRDDFEKYIKQAIDTDNVIKWESKPVGTLYNVYKENLDINSVEKVLMSSNVYTVLAKMIPRDSNGGSLNTLMTTQSVGWIKGTGIELHIELGSKTNQSKYVIGKDYIIYVYKDGSSKMVDIVDLKQYYMEFFKTHYMTTEELCFKHLL